MTEQLPLSVDLGPVDLAPIRPATPGTLRFVVLGRPQPAGSKRGFAIRRGGVPTGRVAVVDANPKAKPWQADVRSAAADALDGGELLLGPLELEVAFVIARPAGHFGTGRNAWRLRPSAPPWPTVRPDVTKLLRAVEDALTGLVWRDDAQVVVQSARKQYGSPERCEIVVRAVDLIGAEGA